MSKWLYWTGGIVLCLLHWGGSSVESPSLSREIGRLVGVFLLPLLIVAGYGVLRRSSPDRNMGRVFFLVTLLLFAARTLVN